MDRIDPAEPMESIDITDASEPRLQRDALMSRRLPGLRLGPAGAQALSQLVGFCIDELAATALDGGGSCRHADGSDTDDTGETNPLPDTHRSLP